MHSYPFIVLRQSSEHPSSSLIPSSQVSLSLKSASPQIAEHSSQIPISSHVHPSIAPEQSAKQPQLSVRLPSSQSSISNQNPSPQTVEIVQILG